MKASIKALVFIIAILWQAEAVAAVRGSGADSSKGKKPYSLSDESYKTDAQLASDFILS